MLGNFSRSLCGLVMVCLVIPIGYAREPLVENTSVYQATTMGTGWALTPTYIVTNLHVIDGASHLRLVRADKQEIPLKLVLSDARNDLAILALTSPAYHFKPLPLATSRPRLGASVFTVGYPHPDLMGTSPKLTTGTLSALSGLADDPRTYQVSVPVQAGNSGGPLLNTHGEVIGIITSKLNAGKMFEWTGDLPQNVNYAVKLRYLRSLIKKLKKSDQIKNGGTMTEREFDELAAKVIDSVVLIAGDFAGAPDKAEHHLFQPQAPLIQAIPPERIIVYSYSEPGNYDVSENIPGSNTVYEYSRNTAKALATMLKHDFGKNVMVITKSGDWVGKIFYKFDSRKYLQSQCENNTANKIILSRSEKNPRSEYRYISYRYVNCKLLKDYMKTYHIVRNEKYDSFGYEADIYTSFGEFLRNLPPQLGSISKN